MFADADVDVPAWYMLTVAVAPFGGTWIMLQHGGTKAAAFGIRFVPAVAVVLSACPPLRHGVVRLPGAAVRRVGT
ncbi:hypothetical protein OV450_4371 [Actinobacteria bacterium OV450]|nr:hypothetical protein OV450_4371 [Actinobacteria bacterium OV450]